MALLTTMRRQNAIYWPPEQSDSYGRPGFGNLVELVRVVATGINYRVRWKDEIVEFIDSAGTTVRSKARVYVPQLPDGTDVQVGGFLWLGDLADLADQINPTANPGASEIRRFDKNPDFKATKFLRTAYL